MPLASSQTFRVQRPLAWTALFSYGHGQLCVAVSATWSLSLASASFVIIMIIISFLISRGLMQTPDVAAEAAPTGFTEVFENQRRMPIQGWGSKLLPTDRSPWSSADGRQKCVVGYSRGALYMWVANRAVGSPLCSWSIIEEITCPAGREWAGDWRLDGRNGSVDGWEYAFDFSATFSRKQSLFLHNVRRRRWVRDHRAIA